MSNDDPWSPDQKELTRGKTFWLKESTLEKLKLAQAAAADPDKIIRAVKRAIEREIDGLYDTRPIGRSVEK